LSSFEHCPWASLSLQTGMLASIQMGFQLHCAGLCQDHQ
jgi:hypothetical protein